MPVGSHTNRLPPCIRVRLLPNKAGGLVLSGAKAMPDRFESLPAFPLPGSFHDGRQQAVADLNSFEAFFPFLHPV